MSVLFSFPFRALFFRRGLSWSGLALVLMVLAAPLDTVRAESSLNAEGLHTQPWILSSQLPNIPEAARKAAENGKTLMVIFEQPGCHYCRIMHETNFATPALVKYLVAHFETYQLNMVSDAPVVGPTGETQTQADMANENLVTGTPTTLFFDGEGKEIFRLPGHLPTAPHYAALQYVITESGHGKLSIASFKNWIDVHGDRLLVELGG